MQVATAILTITVVSIAVYTDVRRGKIYNYLTLPAMAIGLILNTVSGGFDGLVSSLGGIGIGLLLFFLSAIFGRILGGGDIKLLAALGALQGANFLLWALVYTAVIGGVLALVVAVGRGILWQRLKALVTACYLRAVAQVPMEIEPASNDAPRLPYAIAICLGSLVALVILRV